MNKPNHRKGTSARRIKILRREDAERWISGFSIKGLVREKFVHLAEKRFENGKRKRYRLEFHFGREEKRG